MLTEEEEEEEPLRRLLLPSYSDRLWVVELRPASAGRVCAGRCVSGLEGGAQVCGQGPGVWAGPMCVLSGVCQGLRAGPRCVSVRCVSVRCVSVRCASVRCASVRCASVRCVSVRCG